MSLQIQAQTVIGLLSEHMSISRAQMRLQLEIPYAKGKIVKEKLNTHVHSWESESWDDGYEATVLIDPGNFRMIDDILREETRGQARFTVLSVAVMEGKEQEA